jgi:Protein of unknown function (DUF1761)
MGNLFADINWIAVLVGALAYFAIGALWYSPVLFSKRWISDLKIDVNDPKMKEGVPMIFGGSFVLMFVSSLAIAILAARMDLWGWMSGLKLGALCSVCFGAAGIGINYLYEKKPISLFLINAGYQVVGCIVAGIIICMWQ